MSQVYPPAAAAHSPSSVPAGPPPTPQLRSHCRPERPGRTAGSTNQTRPPVPRSRQGRFPLPPPAQRSPPGGTRGAVTSNAPPGPHPPEAPGGSVGRVAAARLPSSAARPGPTGSTTGASGAGPPAPDPRERYRGSGRSKPRGGRAHPRPPP